MGKAGVYKLSIKETGEFYVGETVEFDARFSSHKSFRTTPRLARAMSDYRYHLVFEDKEVLPESCPKEERRVREQHWIDQLKPTLNIRDNPYSMPLRTDAKALVRAIAEECFWYDGKEWIGVPKAEFRVPTYADYFQIMNAHMKKAGLPPYSDIQGFKWDLHAVLTNAFGLKIGNLYPVAKDDWFHLRLNRHRPPLPPPDPAKVRINY